MARPLRVEYPGAWYHVMNRGLCRREVFHTEEYAQLFYDLLEEAHQRYQIEIHAYCLMGNHYHLCVRTPNGNLGKAMQHINGTFTQRYNNLVKGDGPLFRGRYKAILVDMENYFLQLTRYIHLNPVAAGIVKHPADYQWSSYRFLSGRNEKPAWLYFEEILKYFEEKNPISCYEKFVLEGIDPELKSFFAKPKIFPILGSAKFIDKIKTDISQNLHREIPDLSRVTKHNAIAIESIINGVANYYSITPESMLVSKRARGLPRKVAIYLAVTMAGGNQATVAKIFNKISSWAISKIYCYIQAELKENRALSQDVSNIKISLSKFQI